MAKSIIYDKAKYHYEGNYPTELPLTQAFVITGMFLVWIMEKGFYSEEFREDNVALIESLKKKQLTGAKVYQLLDGVFSEDMLNEEGNLFTQHYFNFQLGDYLSDYEKILAKDEITLYHIQDSWENYAKLKKIIDKKYKSWKKKKLMQ